MHEHLGCEWPSGWTPHANLAHAYGVSLNEVKRCVSVYLESNCEMKRKVRNGKRGGMESELSTKRAKP